MWAVWLLIAALTFHVGTAEDVFNMQKGGVAVCVQDDPNCPPPPSEFNGWQGGRKGFD